MLIGTIPLNQAPATQPACDYPTSPLLPVLPTAPPLEFTSENSQEDAREFSLYYHLKVTLSIVNCTIIQLIFFSAIAPSYEMAVITRNTTTSKDTKESQFQAQNNVIGFKPCYGT